MSTVAAIIMLVGGLIALLAGIGIMRFSTPYARFHAAGKASPVSFLVAAIGASLDLGWQGTAALVVAAVAMTLTMPVGVHLLFRAVHGIESNDHLIVDELAADSDEA